MKQHKRVTIKDIAKRLGISYSTVSRALSDSPRAQVNPATQRRVRKTALTMGYRPNLLARAVATRKSGVLGLLTYEIIDPHYVRFVHGLMVEARRQGYQVMMELATLPHSKDLLDTQQVQIWQMISRGVDGLIIHTRGETDEGKRVVEAVRNAVPVVSFSHSVDGVKGVVLDRTAGGYAATKHLIRLGHRRIGLVDRVQDLASPEAARAQGYLRALEEHDLTPEQFFPKDLTLERGYQLGIQIGHLSDRPTALVCWSDVTAVGVCRGLQEVGIRVPGEVAVVGHGGDEIGKYFTPPLTTVDVPVEDICQKVIQLLISELNGDREVRQVVMQPHMVVRKSCGAS